MQVLLAHPGTQSSYYLANELHRHNALSAFHTGFAYCADGGIDRLRQIMSQEWRWLRRLANRRLEGVPANKLHCYPLGELRALLAHQAPGDKQAVLHQRNEQFQRLIPDSAIASAQRVIGFDTSAWILAERCAQHRVPMYLLQTIAHPDAKLKIYEALRERYPAWDEGLDRRLPAVRAAEEQEHVGATIIVASSTFTQQSLIAHGVNAAKIRINPYGVDSMRFATNERMPSMPRRKLRFVFVGALSARKGVPLLLESWQRLTPKQAELWLVGAASKKIKKLLPQQSNLFYLGELNHNELPAVLQQCDVLVFPSYFEGYAKVIPEALACGLPVLTTTATAGPDLLTPGQDGWLIEPGEVENLTEIMEGCLHEPKRVFEMGHYARATAEHLTWADYGRRWMEILASLE